MRGKEVVIWNGIRTPFVKAFSRFKELDCVDLGIEIVRPLVEQDVKVDRLIWGNVIQPMRYPNMARTIGMKAGLAENVPAVTVNMNCASGMISVANAFDQVSNGRAGIIIAGGSESMSNASANMPERFTHKAVGLSKAKGIKKIGSLAKFRPSDLMPSIPSFKDPVSGLTMGETAEVLAEEFEVTREAQDEFALQSHMRAVKAQENGSFDTEIISIKTKKGKIGLDIGPRKDSTLAKLGKLKPIYKKGGSVTAGNSSPITDGSAGMFVGERKKALENGAKDIVLIKDYEIVGVDPSRMGLGPVFAMTPLLKRNGFAFSDFDILEINEAFSAQVLACLKAFKDRRFCKEKLGLKGPMGSIPTKKLNPLGGALAMGHPVGATGARLVVTAANQLIQQKKKRAIMALCVSGGLGMAMILERII